VHEPGDDDFPLAGGSGDGRGAGVVLAGLGGRVAVRVVAEFCEHPGTEDWSQAGLGQVDLSVRVLAKCSSTCPCRALTCSSKTVITAMRDRTVAA
jgi:hypothetical protein